MTPNPADRTEPAATTTPIPLFEVDSPEIDEETFTLAEIAARWPRADVAAIDALAPHRSHRFADAEGAEVKITRMAPADVLDDEDGGFDVSDASPTAAQRAGTEAHARLEEWSRWFDGVTGEMDAARELVPAVLAQVEDLEPRGRIWALMDALIAELNAAPPEVARDLAYDAITIIRQRGPK